MNEIVPRWEWRSFGRNFGEAEARIAAGTQFRAVDSAEIYILSRRSNVNVKIREGVLNVKVLLRRNDDGLEQWTPALKALFPLEASTVSRVLRLLHASSPEACSGSYSLERLIDDVVRNDSSLLPVYVSKRRSCHSLHGCKAELADLCVDGTQMKTVAVEHEDSRMVWLTLNALGLGHLENVNYVRGLKRLKGWEV